jgi:hypothetical protein
MGDESLAPFLKSAGVPMKTFAIHSMKTAAYEYCASLIAVTAAACCCGFAQAQAPAASSTQAWPVKPIINKTHNEVKRIIALPDVAEKLTSLGSRPQAKTPREMGTWLASEKERWAKVVKESGYKIE